ncbi:HGGxSTG domain-containing protein [Cupriavidus sp.]|uniref:HGGxSTG domain-containing protein n=1 Tax=Cupriavidus sp. TaxID=1873897 RepID=UPI003D12C867
MARCGAKTRSGKPCQAQAMPNGRCRMHGGKAQQTHAGNQNARTHGIYSRVLSDEESELWDQVELGKVDDELRLCRLRLMRAIRAETEALNQPELEERSEKPGQPVEGKAVPDVVTEKKYKRRDYAGLIDRLMARVESLERTRLDLIKGGASSGTTASKEELLREIAERLPD